MLHRTIPFVRATLDGHIESAAEILQAAERRHGLRWHCITENADDENQQDAWYREHLWPFLTETHFVLAAGDLLGPGCALLDAAGTDHTPTWREWGALLADWANQQGIPHPSARDAPGRRRCYWEYIDFYDHAYLSSLITGYDAWRSAVWRVLTLTADWQT